MNAYVFPGQASQFPGMGKDLYESSEKVRNLFSISNELLGFDIGEVMFNGTAEDLKETKVTQPAVYLHSMAVKQIAGDTFRPDMVAGHSLGEISALVAAEVLDFKQGLDLVKVRAFAMQKACELEQSTMAAIIGLDDHIVEQVCLSVDDTVVAANYNCPGQLVISGSMSGVAKAIGLCKEKGARMALELQVGGAFHSPFMKPAEEELAAAIRQMEFKHPICSVYQNFTGKATTDPAMIKENLINQLTGPVKWTQTMKNMISDGVTKFYEVGGNGKTLVTFVKRIDRSIPTEAL